MTHMPIRLKLAATLIVIAGLGCNGTATEDGPALSARFEIQSSDIARVEWEVSGGALTTPISGLAEVTVGPPLSVAVTVMDLPVAPGYGIALTAFDATDANICRGTANFDILEGATTNVPIVMTCSVSSTLPSGSVGIDATFQDNVCPVINQINVVPQTIAVGQTAQVSVNAVDPEAGALTYDWTSLAGTFSDPAAATATYTCTQPLDHNVSLTVGDGDNFCNQTRLLNVTCVPDVCVGPPVLDCDDGNQCTDDGACNPVNGCPGSTNSAAGAVCDYLAPGDGLCDGAGVCVECLTATDCTDDGNECTEPASCTAGVCTVTNSAASTACTGGVCDGAGACVGCAVDGDCADDSNECTAPATCNAGACSTVDEISGTACTGGVCNGVGMCVECVDATQCTDDGNDCTAGPSCTTGACDTPANLAAGTGCSAGVCDGGGACVGCVAPTDCVDDGNECTANTCVANTCGVSNVTDGTVCATGTCQVGVCTP